MYVVRTPRCFLHFGSLLDCIYWLQSYCFADEDGFYYYLYDHDHGPISIVPCEEALS